MPHPPGANNGPIGAFIGRTPEHEDPPRSTSERWKAARKRLAEQVDALRDHQA